MMVAADLVFPGCPALFKTLPHFMLNIMLSGRDTSLSLFNGEKPHLRTFSSVARGAGQLGAELISWLAS